MNSNRSSAAWNEVSSVLRTAPPGATIGVAIRSLTAPERFEWGSDIVLPAASTITTLILVGLAQAVDTGRISLSDVVPTGPGTSVGGSGVLHWLDDRLQLSLRDHAWLMIAISDNTASNVIIDAVSSDAIDECRRALGLRQTSLNRRLLGRMPDPGQPDNLATASELVALLAAIWNDEAASPSQCAWMRSVLADQKYRNRLPRRLPDSVAYAGKTGSNGDFVHDCGVLTGPGGSAAVAVLTGGFTDPYAADAFIGELALAVNTDLRLAGPSP